MRYIGTDPNNKIVFFGTMPESEVDSFKSSNPDISIFAYNNTVNTNIMGMTYNKTTGELSGEPTPILVPTVVTIAQFKQLFTAQERLSIKQARLTDPLLEEYYSVLEDPGLATIDLNLQSTKDLVALLVTKNLLTQERASEVLSRTFK